MDRRSFITGLGALIAAPAIVKASSLMPVRGIIMPREPIGLELAGRTFRYVIEGSDGEYERGYATYSPSTQVVSGIITRRNTVIRGITLIAEAEARTSGTISIAARR